MPRADALRNRRRIVDAATDLVLEVGRPPSREAVARAAGVGIATLYRHFPEVDDLLCAAAVDAIDRAVAAGETALAEESDGGQALRHYLHAAIDGGLGVVNVLVPYLRAPDWPDRRVAARDVLTRLVHRARTDGAVGDAFTIDDVAFAAIRFARPLAVGIDRATERAIAHRQLDHYLDGLRPGP